MFVVGVTGGIGSGKSAATRYFEQLGITIVDADLASRAVVEPGTQALDQISKHFGKDILLSNGTLNRPELRKRIFEDNQEKKWLETLLHPLIGEQIQLELQLAKSPYVIFASPLLFEAQQDAFCNHVLVIDVSESLQIKRTVERDQNDENQVRRIIASQISRQERLKRADDVIKNMGSLRDLEQQIDDAHQKYLLMASQETT